MTAILNISNKSQLNINLAKSRKTAFNRLYHLIWTIIKLCIDICTTCDMTVCRYMIFLNNRVCEVAPVPTVDTRGGLSFV